MWHQGGWRLKRGAIFFEKQSGQYGYEVISSFLTYHVKTCISIYTSHDDYKGSGGPFLSKMFELPPMGSLASYQQAFE